MKCCSSSFVHMHRPRPSWPDWKLIENEDFKMEKKEDFDVLRFNFQPTAVRRFLGGHVAVNQDFTVFPCLMRAICKNSPPLAPRGMGDCSQADLAPWAADSHRFAPISTVRSARCGIAGLGLATLLCRTIVRS